MAYLDPGNVASNVTAGSRHGFLLVWVVVLGNVIAWLVQYLSAKLGVVTGHSLAELLGRRIRSPWARRTYWVQAELVAMATDVAEVIGGAVALKLLFGLPLPFGGVITAAGSTLVLLIQGAGRQKTFERVIFSLLIIIAVGFSAGAVLHRPPVEDALTGLIPRFDGSDSVLLAASILGATVMPHAIYAHSALTRDRFEASLTERRTPLTRLLRATRWDVTIALIIAGSVNVAILLLAATTLQGLPGTDTLDGAYHAIRAAIGPAVGTAFAVGLLASGLASTSVGAYAGGEIMQSLLQVRVPTVVRRIVTVAPAIAILGLGVDPTKALVLSQVALSFGIPFAITPLLWLTSQRSLLGPHANTRLTTGAGILASALLIGLNAALICLAVAG